MTESEKKAAAEARNAYAREWRKKNPDKVRANNKAYWMRRAAKEEAARKEAGGGKHVYGMISAQSATAVITAHNRKRHRVLP